MPLLAQFFLIPLVAGIRILPKSQFGSAVNVPLNGPCVLNNENLFKCTKAGYYETVQCEEEGCYCVDAHNGAAAQASRTSNNRTAPICSVCHTHIKNLYASGEPAKTLFVPRCDREEGDYERLQCNGDFCFCVVPKTGQEVPGTRKRREGNFILRCDERGMVSTSVQARDDGQILPVGRDYCRMDRDRGSICNTKQSRIRYYFDYTTFECLAFEHKGCGGNDNRFATKAECESTCLLADFFACSGTKPAARNSRGKGIVCGGMMPDAPRGQTGGGEGCPAGYQCIMGAFFGFCCDKENEDKYARAYRPVCPRGSPAMIRRRDGKDNVLLGKSCSDEFCPRGYSCKEGDVYAYCCPKITSP